MFVGLYPVADGLSQGSVVVIGAVELIRQGAEEAIPVAKRRCGVQSQRTELFVQLLGVFAWISKRLQGERKKKSREGKNVVISTCPFEYNVGRGREWGEDRGSQGVVGEIVLTLPLLLVARWDRADKGGSDSFVSCRAPEGELCVVTVYSPCGADAACRRLGLVMGVGMLSGSRGATVCSSSATTRGMMVVERPCTRGLLFDMDSGHPIVPAG